MVQATYGLWLARNEARDGKKIAPPHEIIGMVVSHMNEWKAVHTRDVHLAVPTVKEKWRPPEEGWLKINSDGAVSRDSNKGGAGAVIRDHVGAFKSGLCHVFRGIKDPQTVEILACKRGLQVAKELNADKVHVEIDSQSVVNMLQNQHKELSSAGPWIQEIKTILASFSDFRVSWVRRSANVAGIS